MRSTMWSAPWFRLFLSLVVACAVFSSPIRVVTPFIRAANHISKSGFLRRDFATVIKQQTISPGEVHRVRFLSSQDSGDETAPDGSLLTWSFLILSLLTQHQWPRVPSSLPSVQSNPPLRG